MASDTPWSDPARIARLSKAAYGADLASRLAELLFDDTGRDGVWNTHRDYCGHGLVYLEGAYRLIVVHDGVPGANDTIKFWRERSDFTDWLAAQSDYSLCGADPTDPDMHAPNASSLNNQRITRSRLAAYIGRRSALPMFRRFLTAVLTEFAFLSDDFEFELNEVAQVGREMSVNYRARHAGISVSCEPYGVPFMTISVVNGTEQTHRSVPLHRFIREFDADWRLPELRRDAGQPAYRSFFKTYARALQLKCREALLPRDAGPPPEKPSGSANRPSPGMRLLAALIAIAAVIVMVAEIRYFTRHGTPDATGSSRANLGIMLLMALPWIVFAGATLQLVTGRAIHHCGNYFDGLPLMRRIGIAGTVVGCTLAMSWLAASIA